MTTIMATTTTTTETNILEKKGSLNNALKFAVEHNNMELMKWIFGHEQKPTNTEDCLMLAIEKDYGEIVAYLMEKIQKPVKEVVQRPLKINENICINMSENIKSISGNNQLMITLANNPEQALLDLEAGIVSKEEINHQNKEGWSALMYMVRNANIIDNAEAIIKKLISLGADVKACNTKNLTVLILASVTLDKIVEDKPRVDVKIIEMLWNHPDVDVNVENDHGYTALKYILIDYDHDSKEMVERILKSEKNQYNAKLMVEVFKYNPRPEPIELLLKTGKIKVNLINDYEMFSEIEEGLRKDLFALLKKYECITI